MKVTELASPDEWPEPEETARKTREYASGDGIGVLVDTLIDERISAHESRHRLQDVVIALDHVADIGTPNARMSDEVTKMHRHAVALAKWYEFYASALSDEVEDIRTERMYDDEDDG